MKSSAVLSSVVVVVFVLLVPLLASLAPAAYASNSTTVTISGQVSTTFTVTVRAHASGTPSSLSGGGTDSPPPNSSTGNPAVCQFPLGGSTDGTTVTLSGTVTQSSTPSAIGTPVVITADASTGAITFNFGGTILTGTGTVVIRTG